MLPKERKVLASSMWSFQLLIQNRLKMYRRLALYRPPLSRITAYLEMKIWSLFINENLTTSNKILWKKRKIFLRSSFSPSRNIFNIKSNYIFICEMWLLDLFVFLNILQIWYVEVRISRSISESSLDFKITRIDCIYQYMHPVLLMPVCTFVRVIWALFIRWYVMQILLIHQRWCDVVSTMLASLERTTTVQSTSTRSWERSLNKSYWHRTSTLILAQLNSK